VREDFVEDVVGEGEESGRMIHGRRRIGGIAGKGRWSFADERRRRRRKLNDLKLPSPLLRTMASSSSSTAQKTFEILNDVQPLDPADEIFLYDAEKQKELVKQAPWKTE